MDVLCLAVLRGALTLFVPYFRQQSTQLAVGWLLIFTMYSTLLQRASVLHQVAQNSTADRMVRCELRGRGFETRLPRLVLIFSLFKVPSAV